METFIQNPNSNFRLPFIIQEGISGFVDCCMLKILYIEEGSTIIYLADKPRVLTAPVVLCLNEKESFFLKNEEGLVANAIFFRPELVNSFLNLENIYGSLGELPETARLDYFYFKPFIDREELGNEQIEISLPSAQRISSLFQAIKKHSSDFEDRFWPCRNRSVFIELLYLIQRCMEQSPVNESEMPEISKLISEVMLFMHLNYNKKVTIEELTKLFHTNRNTLNKRFRSESGLSAIEYLVKLRIKMACVFLRDTSLPIIDVMERVGFSDISYWGRAFKKYTGTTPSAYRKLNTMK